MNLHALLARRTLDPVRVLLIGAGKFGAMFLSQARRTSGLHIVAVADLSPKKARAALQRVGWSENEFGARSFANAVKHRTTLVSDDTLPLIAAAEVEVVIEATGVIEAGIRHALAGPVLARRAKQAAIIYSLAYGDQPALICELVDWAKCSGFEIVAAGKGTKYLPEFHDSTPDTVWEHYGFDPASVRRGDFNARMFNSFLDGTKSAIEMAAVANATGLTPAPGGLSFPACAIEDLPRVLKPRDEGGVLHHAGQVEVVSSLQRDGSPVGRDLRWGVYVVFSAGTEYVRRCFREYGLMTDESGDYSALYRPYHLIGLELGISVASVVLRGEPTGAPFDFRADVAAVAKRDLKPGDMLDGEGGYTVWGKLIPAADSFARKSLPIGLAHDAMVVRPLSKESIITHSDVELKKSIAFRVRSELEREFSA